MIDLDSCHLRNPVVVVLKEIKFRSCTFLLLCNFNAIKTKIRILNVAKQLNIIWGMRQKN